MNDNGKIYKRERITYKLGEGERIKILIGKY